MHRKLELTELCFAIRKWFLRYLGEYSRMYFVNPQINFNYTYQCLQPVNISCDKSTDSTFARKLIITLPKSDGGVSMSESNLTITKDGNKEKFEVNARNYREFSNEHFNLDVKLDRFENVPYDSGSY